MLKQTLFRVVALQNNPLQKLYQQRQKKTEMHKARWLTKFKKAIQKIFNEYSLNFLKLKNPEGTLVTRMIEILYCI